LSVHIRAFEDGKRLLLLETLRLYFALSGPPKTRVLSLDFYFPFERLKRLRELVFIGLGLHDHLGISLRGIEETKTADEVFIELYTSLLPGFSTKLFAQLAGREPQTVVRKDLEDRNGRVILDAAEAGKAVLLVPGDPLIATTHVALRIEAQKRGIRTRIVHGASILSAAISISGLQSYKFGKSVTIPFQVENPSETPYEIIAQNKKSGLHTLCLLDIKADEDRYLSIGDGLRELSKTEARRKEKVVAEDTLAVGLARAGSSNPTVKAGFVRDISEYDFGQPPHSLIFPGKLHFMEAEALIVLAGAPEILRGLAERA
jgi:diphthine synthase